MILKNLLTASLILVGAAVVLPNATFAAKFANQFTEFELPPQWQCNLEGAEWVCQSTNDSKKRDAIIVLAAKLKGDQDSLDQYLTYLKAAKTFTSIQGKPVKSDPKYAKTVNINGQAWVDALHLESEIPGFFTRYLATVKQDIGVLVTYSINKAKYQQYLEDFDNMVKTLKVFRKSGGINVAPANGNLFQNAQIPQNVGADTVFPGAQVQGGSDAKPTKPASDNSQMLMIGAILALGVGFIIWKKRKGGS
jgi:LPXTG-motif cell wall-anchored protein